MKVTRRIGIISLVICAIVMGCDKEEKDSVWLDQHYPHSRFYFKMWDADFEGDYNIVNFFRIRSYHVGAGLTRCRDEYVCNYLNPHRMTVEYEKEDTVYLGGPLRPRALEVCLYIRVPFSHVVKSQTIEIPPKDVFLFYWDDLGKQVRATINSAFIIFNEIVLHDAVESLDSYFSGTFHIEGKDNDGPFLSSEESFDLKLNDMELDFVDNYYE